MKDRISVLLAVLVAICLITPAAVSGSPATEQVEKNVITRYRSINKTVPRVTVGELKSGMDIGYTNVARVVESFKGWLEAGYPVYNHHGEFVLQPNGFEKKE